MLSCTSTPNIILSFIDKKAVASYARLCKLYANKIIYTFQQHPVKTDKASIKFMNLAEKEGIVVYPKNYGFAYDKKSKKDPLRLFCLEKPKYFTAWIAAEGVKQNDCIVLKYFNRINGSCLKIVKSNIHFEYGEEIEFTEDWPTKVTVGRVRKVTICFIHNKSLPIRDVKLVEEIF